VSTDQAAADVIKNHFLGWQCRLRQHSIRHMNGQPTAAARPDVVVGDTETAYAGVTIVIVRKQSADITKEFRHMIKRTGDPKLRYEAALKFMAESYYQHPTEFSENMTALFGPGSSAAENLLSVGRATLLFDEKNQKYTLPCAVNLLDDVSDDWQATFWHNHLFTHMIPGDSQVLQFAPDWGAATAEPAVY
jgi:hypothetical protein